MRILLTAIFAVCLLSAKSQTFPHRPVIVTINCPESFGYVTNVPGTRRSVDFDIESDPPGNIYLVEDLTTKIFCTSLEKKIPGKLQP
jgi:hypothetical protein